MTSMQTNTSVNREKLRGMDEDSAEKSEFFSNQLKQREYIQQMENVG